MLHITAEPVTLEVRFHPKKVEIYGSAPLWARLLLTGKKGTAQAGDSIDPFTDRFCYRPAERDEADLPSALMLAPLK